MSRDYVTGYAPHTSAVEALDASSGAHLHTVVQGNGDTPAFSAPILANGVLYTTFTDTLPTGNFAGELRAFDATTSQSVLWSAKTVWHPIVVNGAVYVGSQAFTLSG